MADPPPGVAGRKVRPPLWTLGVSPSLAVFARGIQRSHSNPPKQSRRKAAPTTLQKSWRTVQRRVEAGTTAENYISGAAVSVSAGGEVDGLVAAPALEEEMEADVTDQHEDGEEGDFPQCALGALSDDGLQHFLVLL